MSDKPSKRYLVLANRAAELAKSGLTHRAIADEIGKRPEQIKAMLLLAERMKQVKGENK